MTNPLSEKRIVLGVTGSIACYKALDIASKLTQSGALVDTILTSAANQFISPLAFRSLTHRPVVTDLFDSESELSINHVALAEKADIVVVAPATANSIGKMANGISDDPLGATILATKSPIVVAPAMDGNMYQNPATQENISKLVSRGIFIAGPEKGRLASGLFGTGRLVETPSLLGIISTVLGKDGDLKGKKIVVSAGGTQEAIDPVRTIGNRSSGKMGYSIAEAARNRGASVTLVTAPTALPDLAGIQIFKIENALDMKAVITSECENSDALVMAAAVSDWRPSSVLKSKAKKGDADTWSVELTRNPDIIAGVKRKGIVKVGFAAESEDLVKNGISKVSSKGLDFIVANDITKPDSGFAVDTNKVVIIHSNGSIEELPLMAKYDVGDAILDRVKAEFES
ncbi:MAG: bifunctional phosphopantothenoylcysteine decarboxylase/phosphopantothenate--cysteine ligase CoaBC [SAR202 cluster bacterium]|jgi:phosphopantothenoylcysteine decarboxylase/phosphopantothenate--cysteine ligase|nr:bifunctional phosphopantothenoylcysteine decarboxylase/phosphopantothenate--cysteine ligase CoaBC [SAR202 cluster bacterium]